MNVTVDRIEGERAILDFGGEMIELPVAALPDNVQEGDTIILSTSSAESSEAKKVEGESRLERLRAKGPTSDEIDL